MLAERIIETELAGILNWALDGLDDLRKRGEFVEPPESVECKQSMIRLANPVRAFISEKCVIEPDASVPRDELYDRYSRWCSAAKVFALSRELFGMKLADIVPQHGQRYRPRINGEQVYHYVGIKLAGAVAEFNFAETMQAGLDLGLTHQEAHEWATAEAERRTVGDIS